MIDQDMWNMVNELLDVDHGFTDREIEFISSMHKQHDNYQPGQVAWLERLWAKHVGNN